MTSLSDEISIALSAFCPESIHEIDDQLLGWVPHHFSTYLMRKEIADQAQLRNPAVPCLLRMRKVTIQTAQGSYNNWTSKSQQKPNQTRFRLRFLIRPSGQVVLGMEARCYLAL